MLLIDPIRPDAARTIRSLRRAGIQRVVMVTGDRQDVASTVGAMIGVDDVVAEQTPADKVAVVQRESARGSTMMVGDGVNDAPALALAAVGVAIGARGATVSSEAADVVLTVDRLDRLGEAHLIARRSRRIATQSVVAGMTMSLVAMVIAAAGYLPAAWGALLQEAIDVAVILNALRSLGPGPGETQLGDTGNELALRFSAEHLALRPDIDVVREAADRLGAVPTPAALELVRRAHRLLVTEIEPHEEAEDRQLYPVIAEALGGTDPTGTMSRTHAEIARLTARTGAILDGIHDSTPSPDDIIELAAAPGAVLIEGFAALAVLAGATADDDPLGGARAQLDVMRHYLRGRQPHPPAQLRSWAHPSPRPPLRLRRRRRRRRRHIGPARLRRACRVPATNTTQARDALGPTYAGAVERGATMTDDELVANLDETITRIASRPVGNDGPRYRATLCERSTAVCTISSLSCLRPPRHGVREHPSHTGHDQGDTPSSTYPPVNGGCLNLDPFAAGRFEGR